EVSFEALGDSQRSYRMIVKVIFESTSQIIPSPIYQPFSQYAQDIFIGSALESAKRAYGMEKDVSPPYPISEVQVSLWKVVYKSVTIKPATPYEPEQRTIVKEEVLLYKATVRREEVQKALDWKHFSTYCHNNATFFFKQVCIDVQKQ
ncbi:MAG: hypothetical protein NZ651_07145, partial [Candidatus Bipolaricaulota bacterium]|nr:hypothetical protein [Candidatus Bipolaricaulota bacterium]MDW8127529.1 hypothetical protein [Candidatus Bipolaricaulota bacterium]